MTHVPLYEFVEHGEDQDEIGLTTVGELIPSPLLTPEETFRVEEAKRIIDNILLSLSPREEKIVRRCIMDEETLDEVGRTFCYTGKIIRQIKNKALRKLRSPDNARILRNCLRELS